MASSRDTTFISFLTAQYHMLYCYLFRLVEVGPARPAALRGLVKELLGNDIKQILITLTLQGLTPKRRCLLQYHFHGSGCFRIFGVKSCSSRRISCVLFDIIKYFKVIKCDRIVWIIY